jgi:hypothetical protein
LSWRKDHSTEGIPSSAPPEQFSHRKRKGTRQQPAAVQTQRAAAVLSMKRQAQEQEDIEVFDGYREFFATL